MIANQASGFIECNSIEEKNGNKNFWFCKLWIFKKYTEIRDAIKNQIKTINSGNESDYWKDFMKMFNSDDDFPLNKSLKYNAMTTIVRCTFEEDAKLYPQILLDDCINYKC